MPASLRKACHACTKAKRRCIPQLPACDRCQRLSLKCVYDLEPVQDVSFSEGPSSRDDERTATPPTRTPVVYSSLRDARDAAVAAFEGGASALDPEAHPLMMADDVVGYVARFFKDVSEDCTRGKPSPYVHFDVVETARRCLTDRSGLAGDSPTSRESSVSNKSSVSERQMTDVCTDLLKIHELILELLGRLTSARDLKQSHDEIEDSINQLMALAHTLWSRDDVAAYTSETWQAWTVSESIRRSVLACYHIRCTWEALTKGYATFTPFLEAIPLDLGAGLWEAVSAEDFATLKHKLLTGSSTLVSLAEFTDLNLGALRPEFDGQLQRLLFVSFNGSTGIDFLTRLDHGTT